MSGTHINIALYDSTTPLQRFWYLIRMCAAFLQLVCYLVEGVVCVVDSSSLDVAHIDWHQDVCASLS